MEDGVTMDNFVTEIIKQNSNLFNENSSYIKLNVGFTNMVYIIDDKYILKICSNVSNESDFKKEISFYIENKDNSLIPKLYYYDESKKFIPYVYEIIEKIDGVSLYNVWHLLDEDERKNIIKQLCDAMKLFHSHIGEKYDWKNYIKQEFLKLYDEAKRNNLFNDEDINLINKTIDTFDNILENDNFVLVHNDLHFDNIFYKDGKIKLIDFERSMIAPKEFELDILYRMVRLPWKFASEETEEYTKIEDYSKIMSYINEFYPELMNIPKLYKKLAIYDMLYFLEQYVEAPQYEDLKEQIISSANIVIEIKQKVEDYAKNLIIDRSNKFQEETKGTKDEYNLWLEHVQYVYKYAKLIAEKKNVDKEVVELSALLHDIAMTDRSLDRSKHNEYGSEIAEKLLTEYGLDKEKIQLVKKCILNHSSKRKEYRTTEEENILVNADAMAHFDCIDSLYSLATKVMGLNEEESKQFVKDKLTRDYLEIDEDIRNLVKEKYDKEMKK